MIDSLSSTEVFALIGLVLLVSTLVFGEMCERAIERHLEEHDSYRAPEHREE